MKKSLFYLLILFIFAGCGAGKKVNSERIQLVLLDDYIIPEDLEIGGTKVGGLSGIDFTEEGYFLIADHPGNPRFYRAEIKIAGNKIDTVLISEVIEINKSSSLKGATLDLEAIRYDPVENIFTITSEGSIQNGKDPKIIRITPEGEFLSEYDLPGYFLASGEQRPRNNGVFEGLAESLDKQAYWVGMELPLKKDGSKPKLFPTKSPVRITRFEKETGKASQQFVMQLEGITKIPWLYFAVNGLTELLEYAPERFIVMERAFSAGHGSKGNTVRLFEVDASNASNTLQLEKLRKEDFSAASKKLIFDFKRVRKDLKEQIIDNLEGMTFGPVLPNGNKTIILASDNNFNTLGKQINQIILMELIIKN